MTSNTIDNTAVATRGTVVLGLMFAVPIAYTVLVLTLAAVSPSTSANLFHALEPVTEVVADFLPITSRYSAQLIEHGYQYRVPIIQHLFSMQFLVGIPFFVCLVLFYSLDGPMRLKEGLTEAEVRKHILFLLIGIGLVSTMTVFGTTIDFSPHHRSRTIRLHVSDAPFLISSIAYPVFWLLCSTVYPAFRRLGQIKQ